MADAYQDRGIGTLLLGALAVATRVDGIKRFHARVLADNPPARVLGDKVNARREQEEPGVSPRRGISRPSMTYPSITTPACGSSTSPAR